MQSEKEQPETKPKEVYCKDCKHFEYSQCIHPTNFSHNDLVSGVVQYKYCVNDMRWPVIIRENDKGHRVPVFGAEGPCGRAGKLFELK